MEVLGEGILGPDREIDRTRMAETIFSDKSDNLLKKVNEIIHPRVKEYILKKIDELKGTGKFDFFFIEAALIIEDGYKSICDEMWYIYADEDIRRQRLKESRGYSDEKIDEIFASQNSDEVFRRFCSVVIDNSGSIEDTRKQLTELFGVR